ncbi:tripartite tricarboxylate transporter substrate binding protein [Ramlibacter sp. WS9]|uniref:Bug family tripartite tricarboxylate transporter substrate binding protein n=1 Tax=Ramlibacter sp. WS9 TaxID=1882741 RepID=UPI0011430A7C|nr:tripartite tricarboxylate transporter substrate binding protein [Ramlibacter sp. WS9]ROZ74973.1 tripartite tricarboxylate transporter substrate binding protein [Ramlibacter sp. WS9]
MKRRNLVAAAALAIGALAVPAQAQDFKGKVINIVVAAPVGTATDVIARLVGGSMSATLGASVVVDNKPGAGGLIAANYVKGAAANGLVVLFASASTVVITPLTYKEARYDIDRDFETVGMIAETPMLLASNPGKGPASLAAAVASVKAKPDSMTMGNPGIYSFPHLVAEVIDQLSGARFRQVGMGSATAGIQAVVNGDLDVMVEGVASLLPMVTAGRLKALAVTAQRELPGLEGIPLAKDAVPDLVVTGWFTFFVPKGTPPALVNLLNSATNTALHNPQVIAQLRTLGTYPIGGSVAEAKTFIKAEKVKWAAVVGKAGIKPQ